MPIIKRRPKENLKPISFRLPEPLLERLSAFADFLNVPQAEIVITALNHVMDSDKEFAAASGASPSPSSRPQIAKERCVTWNMCVTPWKVLTTRKREKQRGEGPPIRVNSAPYPHTGIK
jgi:predicted DNA-binding protein